MHEFGQSLVRSRFVIIFRELLHINHNKPWRLRPAFAAIPCIFPCSQGIAATVSPLIQPASPRLILRHHRPVVLALAVRKCAHQAIAPHVAARQRHADGSAGREREIGVFEPQHGALPGRLVAQRSARFAQSAEMPTGAPPWTLTLNASASRTDPARKLLFAQNPRRCGLQL
jgi:hypothetical protein